MSSPQYSLFRPWNRSARPSSDASPVYGCLTRRNAAKHGFSRGTSPSGPAPSPATVRRYDDSDAGPALAAGEREDGGRILAHGTSYRITVLPLPPDLWAMVRRRRVRASSQ